MHDAAVRLGIDVSVGDIDRAVRTDRQVGRFVEQVGAVAADAGLPQFDQDFPLLVELEDLVALDAVFHAGVDDPEIVIVVDDDAVRKDEHARAETEQKLSFGAEFQNRVHVGIGATVHPATLEQPDIAFGIHVDRIARTHHAAIGHVHDISDDLVGVGIVGQQRILLGETVAGKNNGKRKC